MNEQSSDAELAAQDILRKAKKNHILRRVGISEKDYHAYEQARSIVNRLGFDPKTETIIYIYGYRDKTESTEAILFQQAEALIRTAEKLYGKLKEEYDNFLE